jgi:DNA polymerase I-like protein with 3'-5' exonuclease and polymerase domains
MRTLLYDVETNGLLPTMTTMHCMVLRDAATRETFRFRRHPGGRIETRPITKPGVFEDLEPEDTLAEGVKMLQEADVIAGHNVIGFDNKAIKLIFPDFAPKGKVRDTLVLTRLIMPDTKDGDYRLAEQKRFPGQLIGSHSLDAWGWRVGLHKGDYSKAMLARGLDPWRAWNLDQEDYCENDIDVTEVLWAAVGKEMPPEGSVELEHAVHDICGVMEKNGYFFDVQGAQRLAAELAEKSKSLSAEVVAQFGSWLAPVKKWIVKPQWDDPKGINKEKQYKQPRFEWGEDYSRAVWADMVFPKRTMRSKKLGDRTIGCPYCPIQRKQFNPGSRHHIIEKFTEKYGWVPVDFTDKGFPQVDDSVLQKLALKIPEAAPLAEIAFYNKLLSMVSTGKESWLANVKEDGRIHGYINSGGTVTGRASHNHPNLGQVPSVTTKKVDGKKTVLMGREGEYGWECRSLFYTPKTIIDADGVEEEWVQVGVDLSGIELRCLGEVCAEFDGGKLIEVCTTPGQDVHDYHMALTGLNDREKLKRGTYGLMYGAGDWKLGHTFDPLLTDDQKRTEGARFRAVLMGRVPALSKAINKIHAQAERGYLIGLDGRRLNVRAVYSSLNTRLQSDAALIAKVWVVLTEDYLLDAGLNHGWDGDFAMLTWVHDEIQVACKKKHAALVASLVVKAANDAGKYFNRRCPVDAVAKVGQNWAETH